VAEKFKQTDTEISLACASHGGENDHVTAVQSWLSRIGLSIEALECGVHEPRREYRLPTARRIGLGIAIN
jgi:L-asparaginase II